MSALVDAYADYLSAYPLLTKAFTAAIVVSAADAVSQRVEGKKDFDYTRIGRVGAFASFVGVPGSSFIAPTPRNVF